MKKVTKQELLKRIEKLENKMEEILKSCSCIKSLPKELSKVTFENPKEPICLECYDKKQNLTREREINED
jgi:hypothetical protein